MKIGLTYTGSLPKHENYARWLAVDGFEVIQLSAALDNADQLLGCDGLVLSGGIDIYPPIYGSVQYDYPGADGFDEARDNFEIGLYKSALAKKIPLLGICRGLQLINCIQGGTLKQDLGESLNAVHKGGPDKRHLVQMSEGLVRTITGLQEGEVNSSHHQAIDRVGAGLKVNCVSADGTVEGIEWLESGEKPPMLAVQWHPERMDDRQTNPLSKNIREWFQQKIKENQH